MIKSLLALLLLCSPVHARVDPGTGDLIGAARQYATVEIDQDEDCGLGWMGAYTLSQRRIDICTGGDWDAEDHDTVRHEVWHLIQHCSVGFNSPLEPVLERKELYAWLDRVMTTEQIRFYSDAYHPAVLDAELEAYAAAFTFSAAQITEIMHSACGQP